MVSPGTRLGPYEIVAPIGAGGMGEVYRARDTRLDRTVAIKVLPQHVADDPSGVSASSVRRAPSRASIIHTSAPSTTWATRPAPTIW
jgi:serine/threonine protein kinase